MGKGREVCGRKAGLRWGNGRMGTVRFRGELAANDLALILLASIGVWLRLMSQHPGTTPWRASTLRTASTSPASATANWASACFCR